MQLLEKDRMELVQRICSLLRQMPEVVFAYLYGSFVDCEAFHDIDVGLFLKEDVLRSADIFNYELAKSTALSVELGRDIDLKVLNTKPPAFQYHATAGQLLFTRDDDIRVDFIVKARSLYFDFQIASRRYFDEMTFRDHADQSAANRIVAESN